MLGWRLELESLQTLAENYFDMVCKIGDKCNDWRHVVRRCIQTSAMNLDFQWWRHPVVVVAIMTLWCSTVP